MEKETKALGAVAASSVMMIYELSKISSLFQDALNSQSKAINLITNSNDTTYKEFSIFRSNVEKFAASVSQQIQFLNSANKKAISSTFGPVKKSDKIKPD